MASKIFHIQYISLIIHSPMTSHETAQQNTTDHTDKSTHITVGILLKLLPHLLTEFHVGPDIETWFVIVR